MKIRTVFFFTIIQFFSANLVAQSDSSTVKKVVSSSELSGQWFLAYNYSLTSDANSFQLKRGYFTVRTKINNSLSVRYTQDITLDKEGADAGNVEIRMRYLYLKLIPKRFSFLKNTYFEVGLVHRPWLDYEQGINTYRVQDKMFAEKYNLINSGDLGVSFIGELGKKMDNAYTRSVNPKSTGRYGSFAVGVYNGGGYHSIERNENKTVESRFTLRPLPDFAPGLQFTYTNAFGKGNTADNSRQFKMHLTFVSFEHKFFDFSAQYVVSEGDYGENILNSNGNPAQSSGWALFGEFKIPKTRFALFGRLEDFVRNDSENGYSKGLATGAAYRFEKNKIVLFYNNDSNALIKNSFAELALEIVF